MSHRSCWLCVALMGALIVPRLGSLTATDIAIVDYADEWTQSDALRQTLDEFGYEYDDLTEELEIDGELLLEPEHKLFFIGSMTTNNPTLHANLDLNAEVIQQFVSNGGVVIEPTQADQNESFVDWLPIELVCVRSDPDSPEFTIQNVDHPLFNEPNVMRDEDFQGWSHQGWPTVWEVISNQRGFDVLADSAGRPVIMEAEFGDGLFVMMSLAPDKYHVVGNDEYTMDQAGLFMENILETYLSAVETPPETRFKRGDVDSNGTGNIADAVTLLTFLFGGGAEINCRDSADTNDSGGLDIADAVFFLQFLFSSGDTPPEPYSECGVDGTPDELTCEAFPACE